MADNLFEAKVDLELPVQVFADAYGNISRGLKRIYTKENGDVVFVLTDGTEHIVGNVVGQQGPTGPASTVPGPTGPTGAAGKQGAPGKDGENGAPGIYYGSTQPSGPDFPVWIDPSGAEGIPLSITGPTGATGSPGAKGDKGEPGAKGEPGSPGAKGDKGDPGATPNLTIGTVTTLEAGQNATASMGGTAESPVLSLGIPRGAKGEPGQGGAGAYYVELDGNFPDYALSETTPLADIAAAYNEGKALFCRGYADGYFTIELPLFSAFSSSSVFIFSGSHCLDNTGALPQNAMITITVEENDVYCEYNEYLTQANMVTSVSASSMNSEVPSAKAVYTFVTQKVGEIENGTY